MAELKITSPACSVENRTISEQLAALPKPLPGEGETDIFLVGNLKITESPEFIVLPLHVDKPATSPEPTNHQTSDSDPTEQLLLSPVSAVCLELVAAARGIVFGGETRWVLIVRVGLDLGV